MIINTQFAYNRYQQIRSRLPQAEFTNESVYSPSLIDLKDQFDVYLFDAFGVLNVGESSIVGAAQAVKTLQNNGKHTFVITNAGSVSKIKLQEKYTSLGFDFSLDQIITSRGQLCKNLIHYPDNMNWGVIAPDGSGYETIDANLTLLGDDIEVYNRVDGFIFLGSHGWDQSRQNLLIESLGHNPRVLLVGNPDLIAPRETGFSLEPGFYAHDVSDKTKAQTIFYGKPFNHVYDQLKIQLPELNPARTVMIGDTLHTDIIGGAAAGFKTALITEHGLFKGHDVDTYIKDSNIVPNYILPSI